MIRPEEANHVNDLEMDGHMDVPIGKLDDVEIVFLHYKNPEIAKATWDRRVERVNWDNIIIKNSYMCRCNDQCVIEFQKIRGYKKFMFVPIGYNGSDDKTDLIEIPSRINSTTDLGDDVFDLNKYINLTELINM